MEHLLPMMIHSHGCWREASFPHHMGLSLGLLEGLQDMAASLPQCEESENLTREKLLYLLCPCLRSHISSHFTWSQTTLFLMWKKCYKGIMNTSGVEIIGTILEAGCHVGSLYPIVAKL